MGKFYFKNCCLKGNLEIPGDKSISHRGLLFGAVSTGVTEIENFLPCMDCLSTWKCLECLGVCIEGYGTMVRVQGVSFSGLKKPSKYLDVGNSGTTIRLMMGLVAGRNFSSTFIGDESIAKRPMGRVGIPLAGMGVKISGVDGGNFVPLTVRGSQLEPITYELPVASAQVKSAILLAGLQTNGITTVIEPKKTRNHTEHMIAKFGGNIETKDNVISVQGGSDLKGCTLNVPGDISLAAFWLVAAAITPNSRVTLKNVGLNLTRIGIIDIMRSMGARIEIEMLDDRWERRGNITISTSNLEGVTISGANIPRLIDELPVIALLATQATGETIVRNAEELRLKESDRIVSTVSVLRKLGANIKETHDGFVVKGKTELNGGFVDCFSDHRIGMMLVIASLVTSSPVELDDVDVVKISYPYFFQHFSMLVGKL